MIAAFIESHVRSIAQHTALVSDDAHMTYAELAAAVNAGTEALRRSGVAPGDVVAIESADSLEFIVTLLAIMSAQGLYFCLERSWPNERRQQLVQLTRAQWLITPRAAQPEGVGQIERLRPRDSDDDAQRHAGLCSIYCTSGSTGTPKAVLGTVESITNRVQWLQRVVPYCRDDVAYWRASTASAISAWEMFSPLVAGIALYVPRVSARGNLSELIENVNARRITHLGLVPSLIRLLLERPSFELAPLQRLRVLEIGGEHSPPGMIKNLAQCLPRTTIIHRYGSTEHPAVICKVIAPGERLAADVAAGRPIDGVTASILDESMAPVSLGTTGILHTGGSGLSAGYAGEPQRTASRFCDHRTDSGQHTRLYNTGDLARVNADGDIEILGRQDFMIKLFGHRIAPREVELVLLDFPGVRDAALTKHVEPNQEEELVAWLIIDDAAAEPLLIDRTELRQHLARHLPAYMVPKVIVSTPKLPRLATGKLDRGTLSSWRVPAAAPTFNANGDAIRLIWCRVLGVENFEGDHDFFELGGDSISAMRIVSTTQNTLGFELPIDLLFSHPRLTDFCREVDSVCRRQAQ